LSGQAINYQPDTIAHLMLATFVKTPLVWLTLLLFWALVYLPGVGSHEIRGEEWRRVLPARTMLQTGDFLVPYSGGQPYLRKPPLINWTTALSFKLTGAQTEWTARLPSLLLMLVGTWGTFAFCRRFMGDESAFVSTLFFISCVGTMEKGRIAELEVYYIVFTGLAFAAWIGGFLGKLNQWAAWLWAGLFLGIAFLAKGPAHLLFFYAIILGACWKTRRWSHLWSGPHIVGFLLCFGVILAWAIPFIPAYSKVMDVPVAEVFAFWENEVTSRAGGGAKSSMEDYLLRTPKALLLFLPWLFFAPVWWKRPLLDSALVDNNEVQTFIGIRWGILLSFLIMMLLPGTSARYVAPLLGPVALLNGWLAIPAMTGALRAFGIWRGLIALLGLALLAASIYLGVVTGDFLAWCNVALSLLVVGILWSVRHHPFTPQSVVPLTALTATIASIGLAGVVVVERNGLAGTDRIRPVSLEIKSALQPKDAPLYVYHVGQVPYPFYFGDDTVEINDPPQLPASGLRWMLTTPKTLKDFKVYFERRYGKVESSREFERTWGGQRGQKLVLLRFSGLPAKSS